ncbi:unnamed protein product [Peronospora destructor]|uniref:Uncharacterized protein n=1 Tax=Peronospora destructor TaxID=86335 RepID=A0AAV0V304_9STRA|nr:unnamed protein product [Peronospora destructor]
MKSLVLWTLRILSLYMLHRINAIDVSVCLDATYALASSEKSDICSGNGNTPLGVVCPLKGELAVADCHAFSPSFLVNGSCILQEDAECRIITGTTWGCILPSIGCKQQETRCPTWVVTNSDETVNIDVSHSFSGNENHDENWFVQTSPVMGLYNCGEKPTPTPTEAPRFTTPQATISAHVLETLAPSTLKPPVIETAMPMRKPMISPLTTTKLRTPCPTTSEPVTPRPTITI